MSDIKTVGVWFPKQEYEELYKQNAGVMTEKSSGFDLINVEDVFLKKRGSSIMINLGVVLKLPEGHHGILLPRSSTFRKYQIIQTNSIGLVDEDFQGKEDVWHMPVTWLGAEPELKIPAGTRICQFFIQKRETESSAVRNTNF